MPATIAVQRFSLFHAVYDMPPPATHGVRAASGLSSYRFLQAAGKKESSRSVIIVRASHDSPMLSLAGALLYLFSQGKRRGQLSVCGFAMAAVHAATQLHVLFSLSLAILTAGHTAKSGSACTLVGSATVIFVPISSINVARLRVIVSPRLIPGDLFLGKQPIGVVWREGMEFSYRLFFPCWEMKQKKSRKINRCLLALNTGKAGKSREKHGKSRDKFKNGGGKRQADCKG